MIFLVPIVNGKKLDNTWKKLPEKHLFHNIMHVVQKVANATPQNIKRTHWYDMNFVNVFFHEFIRSATIDCSMDTEAIVWLTQPS